MDFLRIFNAVSNLHDFVHNLLVLSNVFLAFWQILAGDYVDLLQDVLMSQFLVDQ